MIQHLVENEEKNCVIIITGDHSSPVKLGDHSYHPVPFAISTLDHVKNSKQKNLLQDGVQKYDEIDCAKGVLGRFEGNQIMEVIKNFSREVFK